MDFSYVIYFSLFCVNQGFVSFFNTAYNPDDPLAGLGLSEDEDFSISKKKTTPHKKPLSRRLSGDKMRIEPKQGDADDKEPYRSPSKKMHCFFFLCYPCCYCIGQSRAFLHIFLFDFSLKLLCQSNSSEDVCDVKSFFQK